MKKIYLSVLTVLLFGLAACTKSGLTTPNTTPNVSSADAADMVSGSLATNADGMASVSNDASIQSQAYVDAKFACGSVHTDTISRSSANGAAITYSYGLGYTYTLNCNGLIPDNVTGKLNYSGNYSGPNVSSSNTGTSIFTLAGLAPTAVSYVFNGSYLRSGSFASKVDTTNHGNSNLDIEVKNLTITKPARTIASGTATFMLSGTVLKKGTFNYAGALTFNGDGTATLIVNGTSYSINLTTGVKTKL